MKWNEMSIHEVYENRRIYIVSTGQSQYIKKNSTEVKGI